jgi:hypothetical protein
MEDVLISLAEQWSATGQACTLQALAASKEVGPFKILTIAEGMFDWMKKYEDLSKLGLVLFQSSPHIKKLESFMDQARAVGRRRIREFLEQETFFRDLPKAELEKIVIGVHSVMYGFFLYAVAMDDYRNLNLHRQNCLEALSRLIQSYLK